MGTTYKTPILDSNNLVPTAKLGTGTANNTTFLRGDQTWAVPSGSGSNTLMSVVDFGPGNYGPEQDIAYVTITGQSWVTTNSIIEAWVGMVGTADHDPEDALVENLNAFVTNLVPGVGFDIVARAPTNTWGKYVVYARGS